MNKNKNYFFKKSFLAIAIALGVSLSPFQVEKSHAWLSFQAAQYKQMLETIQFHIDGVILGMLKQQAASMLNDQINKLVGGGSTGSVMFITDWRDYLVSRPEGRTRLYMNDYLTQMTSGRGSRAGYVGEGFLGGGNAGAYNNLLVSIAKKQTTERQIPKTTYPGDPSQMFAQGNFKNMGTYLSGINNPWAFSIAAQNEYQKRLAEEKKIAESLSIAYGGFRGTEVKGRNGEILITNPGSVIKQAVTNVQDIGNKIVAAATHPQEVISAIVSQMMTQAIQQGIGIARNVVEKEVNKVTDQFLEATGGITRQVGPAILYGNSSSSSSGSVRNRSGMYDFQEGAYRSYRIDSSGEIYRH